MSPEVQTAVDRVVAHAMANRSELRTILRTLGGSTPPPGDNPLHAVCIPMGFRCVFTIDQGTKGGWFRHLSVSVDTPGKTPNEHAMQALMAMFGFTHGLEECRRQRAIWLEEDSEPPSINVCAPLEGSDWGKD